MATMTITVKSKPAKAEQPFVLSDDNNSCIHTKVIRVIVPAGQSRHVVVTNTGTGTNAVTYDRDETITTTTDYTLEVDGSISSNQSQNTEYGASQIYVSMFDGGPIFYANQVARTHTGNIC
jgi:hypothetical protein